MAASSKQEVDSQEHQAAPVARKETPSILALGKLFPQNKTLDKTVRFLSQVRGTDKTLMVRRLFPLLLFSREKEKTSLMRQGGIKKWPVDGVYSFPFAFGESERKSPTVLMACYVCFAWGRKTE